MRKSVVLWGFVAAVTAAWALVTPQPLHIFPLVDASGTASGWWLLRSQAMYWSGLLSIALMSLCMVLALRLPWTEAMVGGMDQVYRLHKWAGIGAGATAILHWGVKESSGWIREFWGAAGKPLREAVLPFATGLRGPAKDLGEWAFYALCVLLVITLWQQLANYRRWRWTHRVMPLLYLALALHTVLLMPLAFWRPPLGVMTGVLLVAGSMASLIALSGRIGASRRHEARVQSVARWGDVGHDPSMEVVLAVPQSWPAHQAGQFVFATFDDREGAHPFTIASAVESVGRDDEGARLLRLVIKPLGDYTQRLQHDLQPGQAVTLEGPYGCFDAQGDASREQVWVAAGVGVTPFIALLEDRQQHPVHMHYCTRDARHDALLVRVQWLCDQALPRIPLTVHDAASGERFDPSMLKGDDAGSGLDIWFCGPAGLAASLRTACRRMGRMRWHLHHELFAMR